MEEIISLKDLLIAQLRELYNAEKQQHNALTSLHLKATNRELKLAIQNHLNETDEHISRLEDILHEMEVAAFGEQSEAMQGLIKEGYNLVERSGDPEILDVSIITAIQYMEHFEIAGYGTACAHAKELGLVSIAEQLQLTLKEELRIDERLSEIAIDQINKKAMIPVVSA